MTSYTPDLSFVHAWAADQYGNAICYPPFGENIYGALAAKAGVVVTAEHIVSTSFIRQHANLVRIPAAVVRSVSHVPWGCHPAGNYSRNIPEFEPFGNDYQFMKECRAAAKTAETFDDWIQEWILDVKDHGEYVAKLGEDRKRHLHFVATRDSWRPEIDAQEELLSSDEPPSAVERMIVEASRMLAKRIVENEYQTVLSGVGQATLLAWLAAHDLQEDGRDVTLMAETGIYGHDPRPADPFVFNFRNLPTTTVLTDIFETLGLHTGGGNNRCIGTIGAAQVDKHGNVNSTRSKGRHIVGSGGANDIATAALETIVLAQQRPSSFVDEVEYITSPGEKIRVVVSTLGRFEKRGGDELRLTGVFLDDGQTQDEAVAAIQELCGWALEVADDCEALTPPTERELALLRLFDCERLFIGKAVSTPPEPVPAK
jgi:acyl CoA:acetate/3-ketoacid CoA transferase beta subunit